MIILLPEGFSQHFYSSFKVIVMQKCVMGHHLVQFWMIQGPQITDTRKQN